MKCAEEYELKSKSGGFGKKIPDGAYGSMISRLRSANNPNFLFLAYDKSTLKIQDFLSIPKYFFVPDIIERRKALNPKARRAGWVGCNIVLDSIPELGKIYYVKGGKVNDKADVLKNWSQTKFVNSAQDLTAKGWLLDVIMCVERLDKTEFTLNEVYQFAGQLEGKYRANNNIKAKIRQQLQFLRDKGYIDFQGRGSYRIKIARI